MTQTKTKQRLNIELTFVFSLSVDVPLNATNDEKEKAIKKAIEFYEGFVPASNATYELVQTTAFDENDETIVDWCY